MRLLIGSKNIFVIAMSVMALTLFVACTPSPGQPGGAEPTSEPQTEPTATPEDTPTATPEPQETPTSEGGEQQVGELAGSTWNLVSLSDREPLPDSTITLDFTAEEIGGSAGCNHYGAPYTLDGESFTIGEIVSTMMACDGLMEQEQLYLDMLRTAESLTLEQESMTIHTAQGDLVYEPAQHLALEQTEWTLSSIARDEALHSTRIDAEITAVFEDGHVAGSAGCNSYSADYTLEGQSLTLSPVISTEMACEDEERMQREQEFLAALQEVAGYDVVRSSLTLTGTDGNTLLTFTAESSS